MGGFLTFRKQKVVDLAVGCMGCALVAAAIAADQQWFDQHFLPTFFVSRARYVAVYWFVRTGAAALGLLIAFFLRRPIARSMVETPARALLIALAVVMAFGAAELVLRHGPFRAAEEVPTKVEPRRRLDARLGWVFVPSRTGAQTREGRRVEYSFDGNGYRVPRVDQPVEPDRPSVIFAGESMMTGERLQWSETIPAQTGNMMAIQTVNTAVSGYATDQVYLRLASELPRFRRPVGVVLLFAPAIFDRNLDDDRPHLGPGLVWMPPAHRWRLAALFQRIVHYRGTKAIERGIDMTREVLGATVALARARGATPLIVVPQFGAESERERELRQRILDQAHLPYVWVPLDPAWRVPDDGHPDARAAHAIAVAIAARLREEQAGLDSARLPRHETTTMRDGSRSHGERVDDAELSSHAGPPSVADVRAERHQGVGGARRIHRAQSRRLRRMSFR